MDRPPLQGDTVSTRRVEYRTEHDTAIALESGPSSYSGDVLRVKCRPVGGRRWHRFLLVPDEGEGFDELEAKAEHAAIAYLEKQGVLS